MAKINFKNQYQFQYQFQKSISKINGKNQFQKSNTMRGNAFIFLYFH